MTTLPSPCRFFALAVCTALAACSDAPPAAGSHLGTPNATERVRGHLEAVGHAVEDGSSAMKSRLEALGTTVSEAAASVGETVETLQAPPVAAPPQAPTASQPRSYEAPEE